MDHVMEKLTLHLCSEYECALTPIYTVHLYKQLVILQFVHTNCPRVSKYINTFYHEEIK